MLYRMATNQKLLFIGSQNRRDVSNKITPADEEAKELEHAQQFRNFSQRSGMVSADTEMVDGRLKLTD